ncbi:alanyl-tRNA synthetase [Cryptosporidium ubiquitum]|uniref:Alanine--tRNA ligase n=1 Tax=Cryptosporidium ubiquitum TaxID=857276 RepID=A0A1J4MG14_9CRYT|nr:alanyl-tRNA synthetase [Cryptosporidium ubiquitum]OII72951.1 alanyl-tRNA synthetase [Cryptosporidium ubiquitum]
MNSETNKVWTGDEVRRQFVEYFKELDHTFYRSSPVIPLNDPTILFINAGMNQFKSIFLGTVEPNSELSKLVRVVNSQKCIRAGGKHNDLDDVGKDVYHHTFFEMLGSWSFGDYFKEEAIGWAFKLLTQVYGISKDRLYATYFGGDPKLPLCPPDEEAKRIWLKYLPEGRILSCGSKENFWEMADTGPCGPCSEIHYDRIGGRDASSLVNKDDPDVIEIWNLVFMQYYREIDTTLTPLPRKCVDTGMGLERLVSILQNKTSNYDIDLFKPIFDQIYQVISSSGVQIPPYSGKVGEIQDPNMIDMSYRVIADHIRTLTIAIADGCIPSNEGRGYVLRRILRRAIRYGSQYLKAGNNGEPWFYKLVDSVSNIMGGYYKEIPENIQTIKEVILDEEKQFSKTLFKGTERFNKVINKLKSCEKNQENGNNNRIFPPSEAFQLYSTYGFPMDLTELMAKEQNFDFDRQGFQICMENHHLASEGKNNKSFDDLILKPDIQNALLFDFGLKETDDQYKYHSQFQTKNFYSNLIAIFDGNQLLNSIEIQSKIIGLIFDKTTFYSESGGQVADTGFIDFLYNDCETSKFQVIDCKKFGKYVLHIGILLEGKIEINTELKSLMSVDYCRRNLIKKNHTGTHILNFALRQILGSTCDQKGSVVDPNRLRFDFSSQKPLSLEQIEEIEKMINNIVQEKQNVYCQILELSIAKQIPNIRAIFGETYPDPVRVLSVGKPIESLVNSQDDSNNQEKVSIEFCGGTHIENTGEIISFSILSEEGIAKGIRRIVAVTDNQSETAIENAKKLQQEFNKLNELNGKELETLLNSLKAKLDETKLLPLVYRRKFSQVIEEHYKKIIADAKKRQKERLNMAKELATKIGQDYSQHLPSKDEFPSLILNLKQIEGDSKSMDVIGQDLSKKYPETPIMLFTSGEFNDNGVSVISIMPKSKSDKLSSSNWLKSTIELCNGKCGGTDLRSVGSSKNGAELIDSMVKLALDLLKQHNI